MTCSWIVTSGVCRWSAASQACNPRPASSTPCGTPSAGRPAIRVAELFGGHRKKLRVYRTCVFHGKPDQSDVAYETQANYAVRLKKTGYTAMKVRAWRTKPMDDADMVDIAVRSAVGNDFEIMLDRTAVRPGWVWDYPTALQVAPGSETSSLLAGGAV